MSEPTIAACLKSCRAHKRRKRFRAHVTYARAYFAVNRMGTASECAELGKEAGLDYALLYLIAVIVWRVWQAWWDKKSGGEA